MHYKKSGFTIVELLIVIVIIGILTLITIVAYSGIQTRAQNSTVLAELKQYQKNFEAYKAQVGTYPVVANGGYCLGKGFPIGGGGVARCRDYESTDPNFGYLESGSTSLMTLLSNIGTISQSKKYPVNGSVGPYAIYTALDVKLFTVFKNLGSQCPGGLAYEYDDGAGRLICSVTLVK